MLYKSHVRKKIAPIKVGLAQSGASISELLVAMPLITFMVLGVIQIAFVYNAKMHLNHATFEAARSGAVNHALRSKIREAFTRHMVGLYGGGDDFQSITNSLYLASKDLILPEHLNGAGLKIEILNPTKEAFDDFGEKNEDNRLSISNSYLQFRDSDIGKTSHVSIQDANILKIRITYGYRLWMPVVDKLYAELMKSVDPKHYFYYRGNPVRVPMSATAVVRMHSDPILNGNLSLKSIGK